MRNCVADFTEITENVKDGRFKMLDDFGLAESVIHHSRPESSGILNLPSFAFSVMFVKSATQLSQNTATSKLTLQSRML